MSDTVQKICRDHAPRAGGYIKHEPSSFIGKIVKIAFPFVVDGQDRKEYMWVYVEAVIPTEKQNGCILQGRLRNIPVFVQDVSINSDVFFSLDEICEVDEIRPADCEHSFRAIVSCFSADETDLRLKFEEAKSSFMEKIQHAASKLNLKMHVSMRIRFVSAPFTIADPTFVNVQCKLDSKKPHLLSRELFDAMSSACALELKHKGFNVGEIPDIELNTNVKDVGIA